MLPRFLVPSLDPDASEAVLPADEAHHLTRVLRLQAGDDISVFDGQGHERRARVASIGRAAVTVTLLECVTPTAVPPVPVLLVQSVLKGDAMDDVVRDAVMAGVDAIQPVVSARTTVNRARLEPAGGRWRRIAHASSKQCGRATLPRVHEPVDFEAWLLAAGRGDAFLLVEPSMADEQRVTVRTLAHQPVPATASLLVGPEGGWTEEEVRQARAAGCTPLSLGPMTLRSAAVPLAALAALLAIWQE
jgi:16S rRNA (uracil1498-N3)-methyltransferase